MPELPEVETIRRQILDQTKEKKIASLSLSPNFSSLRHFVSSTFGAQLNEKLQELLHSKIIDISRHGKYLFWKFSNTPYVLLSHLGMSGRFEIHPTVETFSKHTHLAFHFDQNENSVDDSFYLCYVDPRRFGSIGLYEKETLVKWKEVNLGPDLLSDPFPLKNLQAYSTKYPNKFVKELLLSQKEIAGIGNYLASEILAYAKIIPTRPLGTLSINDFKQISKAAKNIIDLSLKHRGLSFDGAYRDLYGEGGGLSQMLKVYQQKICGFCQESAVDQITLAGRSTFFCTRCQK